VGPRFVRVHLFRREIVENGKTALGKGFHQARTPRAGGKKLVRHPRFHRDGCADFSFATSRAAFYSGTKALGEEAIAGIGQSYIWRLRIPFDEFDNARNYLSKVHVTRKSINVNSISHRADFVKACLDTGSCARRSAPTT